MEHEVGRDTSCNSCARNNLKRLSKGTGRFRNHRTNRDHPNNSIKNGQNTEKSPGDLRRLAITQTPVKANQLTQVGKNWKEVS